MDLLSYLKGKPVIKLGSLLLLWLYSGYTLAAPALWSATKGEQQLWLFGSIHLADERLENLPAPLLDTLKLSERLYLEIDPQDINQAELAPLLTLKANDSWQQRLGAPLAAELTQALAEHNLSQLTGFTPWFAVLQLSQAHAKTLGFSSQQGVDMRVLSLAKEQGLPVAGLESAREVFHLLSSLDERGLEADFVRHTLNEQDDLAEHLTELFTVWQQGDEHSLWDLLQEQAAPELDEFIEQELLFARNQAWLDKLQQDAPQRALLVVGALHLYGEHGLIKLLKRQGYRLKRLKD